MIFTGHSVHRHICLVCPWLASRLLCPIARLPFGPSGRGRRGLLLRRKVSLYETPYLFRKGREKRETVFLYSMALLHHFNT